MSTSAQRTEEITIMALIACPECSRDISEKAAQCPNCGCPAAAATTTQKGTPGVQALNDKGGTSGSTGDKSFQLTKPTRGFGREFLVGVLTIVSVVVLLLGIAGIKSCMDEAATKRAEERFRGSQEFKNAEKQAAERAAREAAKDATRNLHLDKK
ncbi:MAG: hypothetical protein EDM82_08530 [Cyanobacteria bacterium CYA]|nr:MAG: hypothetical protein EDM82_08530 [Cyanobacteria bacterium CYA]